MSEKQGEGHTPFHHIGPQNEIQVSGLMATSFSFRAIPVLKYFGSTGMLSYEIINNTGGKNGAKESETKRKTRGVKISVSKG